VSGETLYVGGENGVVYAIDRGSGQLLWKHPLAGAISWAPFVVDQELFVIGGNKVVVLEAD
jgi:outer membrane protein assembly factor BamB